MKMTLGQALVDAPPLSIGRVVDLQWMEDEFESERGVDKQ